MTVEAKIREALTSALGRPEVYLRGSEPGGLTFPHVSFFRVTSSRIVKESGLFHIVWQIDTWAKNYADARTIADSVQDALEGFSSADPEIISFRFRSEAPQVIDSFHQVAQTWDMDMRS